MADLISLFKYQKTDEDHLPRYVVFQCDRTPSRQSLSPDIMQLTDLVYVANLSIVESYWQKVASTQNQKLHSLIEKIVQKNFDSHAPIVFCDHPFQGLVFFNHLQNLQAKGPFYSHSLFSKKVYQNMGWYPWLMSARQIHDCFKKNQCFKKERQNFHGQLARFSRFVERVDLQEFSALKQAHFYEISRRFKSFLGLLWKWTFPQTSPQQEQGNLFQFQHYENLAGFPWAPYYEETPAEVKNLLEFPLSEWEAVKDLLLCDLEKLSRSPNLDSPYKVLQMRWTLTLFDMSEIQQNIGFKYPISFNEEKENDFPVLIKQLQFSFEQIQKQWKDRWDELEMTNAPLIVGWKLHVSQRILLSQKSDFMDVDEHKEQMQQEELVSLSHKVPSGIQSFQLVDSFVPGLDFSEKQLLEKLPDSGRETLHLPQPFYLFPQEQELKASEIKSSQFLDRTSSDWWNRQDALDSFRDCFLCELNNKEFVFAYRNYQGKWFRYGY